MENEDGHCLPKHVEEGPVLLDLYVLLYEKFCLYDMKVLT
jgi:hypothetical protein